MRKINLEQERIYENANVNSDNMVRFKQRKYYYAVQLGTDLHNAHTLKEIKNKVVLEIGCSMGEMTRYYSKTAKFVHGCDISDRAIEEALKTKTKNTDFMCCDAHKLPYSDETFDIVIVNSILHHLDLKIGLKEIKRVLKYNGKLSLKEPLGINPLYNFYRKITPYARTVDERPFDFDDLSTLNTYFESSTLNYYGFLNLFSAFVKIDLLRLFLTKIDYLISKTPMKYLFWHISGVLPKK